MASNGWDDAPATTNDSVFNPDNVSKHDNGAMGNGTAGDGCRICHAADHFARDCPEKKENTGECYNCGEMGHNKAECTNERVEREFTGNCRICEQAGHRAADCPSKPPTLCKICKHEGHIASECSANRMQVFFNGQGIQDKALADAWNMIEAADKSKDVDDIKTAVYTYAKAYPQLTLSELEQAFRDAGMNTHFIAKAQEVSDTHVIINLQGVPDQKYVVSFQFGPKPRRAKFAEGWPETAEENIARLAEAGFIMDRMIPKCGNCGQMGHGSRQCTEDRVEREKVTISCANCNAEGHRARDCPEPRKSLNRGCKNCGQEGHIAKECPEPRNPDNVECKNCNQMGHFARDCPDREPELCRNCNEEGHRAKDCDKERVMICRNCDGSGHTARECDKPKDMSRVQCRNCDEFGHTSRECKKPTDWSRVECSNCHEKGHSYKRCTKEPEETGGDGGWDNGDGTANHGTTSGTNGDGWGEGFAAAAAAPVAPGDGW